LPINQKQTHVDNNDNDKVTKNNNKRIKQFNVTIWLTYQNEQKMEKLQDTGLNYSKKMSWDALLWRTISS